MSATRATPRPPSGRSAAPPGVATARVAGLRPPLARRLALGDEADGHHAPHVARQPASVARLVPQQLPRPQSARMASPAGAGEDGGGLRRMSALSGAQTSRPVMSGRAQSARRLPIAAMHATPRSSSGALTGSAKARSTGASVARGLTGSSITHSPGAAVPSTRLAASAGNQRAGALGVRPATARAHGCKQHVAEQLLPRPAAAAGLKRPGTASSRSSPAAQTSVTSDTASRNDNTATSCHITSRISSSVSTLQTARPTGDWRKRGVFAAEFKMDSDALIRTTSDHALSVSHRPPPVEQDPFHQRLGNHLIPAREKTAMLRELKALVQTPEALRLLDASVVNAIIESTRTGLEEQTQFDAVSSVSRGEELCIAGLELLCAVVRVRPRQPGVREVVLESTSSSAARVRLVAIHSLETCVARGDAEAQEAAIRGTSDPDWLVRAAACTALAALAEKNDPAALRALTAQLHAEDWGVRTCAQAALARLADAHRGWDALKAMQMSLAHSGASSLWSGRAAIRAMSGNHLVAEEDLYRERVAALELSVTD